MKWGKVRNIPISVTFFLILFVFLIMLVTMIIMGSLIYFLFEHGMIDNLMARPTILMPLCLMGIVSTVIASALTGLVGRIPLSPVRRVINGINRLAEGDFSVRLNLKGTNEFTELSKSFNRMAEELGSIEMLRSDFVNTFSHEFKTPIVSLRGFAKILKNKDLTPEERDEYLDIIITESDRLSSLSKSVLILSSIDNLSIPPEGCTFDLTEQLRRTVLVLEPKWSAKNLDMAVDFEEIKFHGNAELLNHVWLNLIDNSIKFTPKYAEVLIKLWEDDTGICFRITDSGPGISPETAKHIFNRFYQGDLSHTTEGNGIGLAIVEKVVKLYGGKVAVESEPGISATFTVTLPKGALS